MGIACVAGGIRGSAVVFGGGAASPPASRGDGAAKKVPGKRIQCTQARVGKKVTLLKKFVRLVSSNIYLNVLKA